MGTKTMRRFKGERMGKKRFIAVMLSLALILGAMPGAAFAQPEDLVGYESNYTQENYELTTDETSESEEYATDEGAADVAGDEVVAEAGEVAAGEAVTIAEEAGEIAAAAYGYEGIQPFTFPVLNSAELFVALRDSLPNERIYLDPNFVFDAPLGQINNSNRTGDINVTIVSGVPGVQTLDASAVTGHLMNFQSGWPVGSAPVFNVTLNFEDIIIDGGNSAGSIRYFGIDGTLTVNNVTMQNFGSFTNGGFLHSPVNSAGAHIVVNNSTFINGVSPNAGGAIYVVGPVTAVNSTFIGNTSNGLAGGGAIHSTSVNISNSSFENNTAALAGGGAISTGSGTITNTDFENNTARNGGALLSSGVMNVTNSVFVDNAATITQAALDAMIFGVDPDPVFNPTPLPQWALDAGWTSWTEIFTYSMGGGGAINHSGPGLLTVRDSDFIDNTSAANGGSIWARADHRDVWCDNGEDAFGAGVDCGNFFSGNTPPQYFESCAFPTVTFRFYTRSADGTVTAHVGTLTRADIPVGTTITLAMVPALAGFPGADFLPAAFMPNYTAVVVVEDAADNMVRVVFVARTPEVNVPNNPCPNDPTQECECPVPPPVSCDDCEKYPCECDTETLETDTGNDRRRPAGEGPKTGDNTNFFAQIAAMAALVVTVAVTGLVRTREQD